MIKRVSKAQGSRVQGSREFAQGSRVQGSREFAKSHCGRSIGLITDSQEVQFYSSGNEESIAEV